MSYGDDDAVWIKNILSRKLEKEWGLRLCIRDRDFDVGEATADVIIDCIKKSRNVIFLITPSIGQEEWFTFTLDRAKYDLFVQNVNKIIVIAKGVSVGEIPPEVARIWPNISFLKWPEEDTSIDNSWNKLKLWLFIHNMPEN